LPPLGSFLRVIASGILSNMSRILFRSDRATSKELRNKILSGEVKPYLKENWGGCLGCGACANTCPMECITMEPIEEPVEILPGFIKKSAPKIDPMKCIYCFQCHDNCPVTALFGLPATIHPREVANPRDFASMTQDPTKLVSTPVKIPEEKIVEIQGLLADEASELLRGVGK
jgi:energy-converting hydrogenase B subunit L